MIRIEAKKYEGNPIFVPRIEAGSFEKGNVYNPAAVVKDGKVFLLYRAEEGYYDDYISRIGLATSEDGFAFERFAKKPIIDIDSTRTEEDRGCEDPRVMKAAGRYFLTYTAFGGGPTHTNTRLCGAFSHDLIRWKKIGKLLPGREKAGAVVQDYKHKGEYVMYFGEGKAQVAFSKDLSFWRVRKQPVLEPREGFFDDFLVEPGPPPMVTEQGILLIYNSAKGELGWRGQDDREFVSYAVGAALFDKEDPTKLLWRTDAPLLEVSEYWEKYGKVNNVVFATGLVHFKDKWLLYYGGADKAIGVAELTFGA